MWEEWKVTPISDTFSLSWEEKKPVLCRREDEGQFGA